MSEDRRSRWFVLLLPGSCCAELATNAGATAFVNPARFQESSAVAKAISSLSASSSLAEFYLREVELSDGTVGTFKDLGRRVDGALADAES